MNPHRHVPATPASNDTAATTSKPPRRRAALSAPVTVTAPVIAWLGWLITYTAMGITLAIMVIA